MNIKPLILTKELLDKCEIWYSISKYGNRIEAHYVTKSSDKTVFVIPDWLQLDQSFQPTKHKLISEWRWFFRTLEEVIVFKKQKYFKEIDQLKKELKEKEEWLYQLLLKKEIPVISLPVYKPKQLEKGREIEI